VDERKSLVIEVEEGDFSIAELCRRYSVSRETGYTWLRRYRNGGVEELTDHSRAPQVHPNQMSDEVAEAVLAARRDHPHWGPRKLKRWLTDRKPNQAWPATSTIGALLKREGLTVPRRRRRRTPPYEQPFAACTQANAVWCADFKGWFRTSDGQRCDPLTISDATTRYLLRCQAVAGADGEHVRAVFEAAFREYGLPEAVRTDNGAPFATRGLGGLSRLSIEWIKLGIQPERIQPGHPEQNGRHERMHRTLKAETASPPAENRRAQQRRFDRFRTEYNEERPHEALGQHTPASLYVPSYRIYPSRVAEVEYPADMVVRKVRPSGAMKWSGVEVFVSDVLEGEYVGLAPIDDRYYRMYFAHLALAVFDAYEFRLLPTRTGALKQASCSDKSVNHVPGLKCQPCARPHNPPTGQRASRRRLGSPAPPEAKQPRPSHTFGRGAKN